MICPASGKRAKAFEGKYIVSADYVKENIDLAFTGHAHGGQIIIPFLRQGIFAPNQGFFPKYTEGMHEKDGTVMVVSRGLGNSSFPFRIFNRPELIEVTLTVK